MIKKKTILFLMFLSSIAICTGCFYEVYMNGTGKTQMMELIFAEFSAQNSPNFLLHLKNSFVTNTKYWLLLLFCPFIPIFVIVCPILCIVKGFSIGFSSTMLIEIFGFKGMLYILMTIVPQNLIQLPLYCFLSSFSIQTSLSFLKYYLQRDRKRNKNALQVSARHHLTIFLIGAFVLFISCLIEACLKQFLL